MDKERYVDPLKDWERKNKSSPNFAFLIPDSRQMPYDIFIPLHGLNDAKNGHKAKAKI